MPWSHLSRAFIGSFDLEVEELLFRVYLLYNLCVHSGMRVLACFGVSNLRVIANACNGFIFQNRPHRRLKLASLVLCDFQKGKICLKQSYNGKVFAVFYTMHLKTLKCDVNAIFPVLRNDRAYVSPSEQLLFYSLERAP